MKREDWPPEVAHLPVCPKRDLPAPYIAEVAADGTVNFTILDEQKARKCLKYRLCAMCGLPMGAEVALLGDVVSLDPENGWYIEPPVHERCGVIAAGGMCPFLSGERVPRRTPDDDVTVVGMTPEMLTEVGRTVGKRPLAMAITKSYTVDLVPGHTGYPVMVYRAGPIERVRWFAYDERGRLAEVVLPSQRSDRQPPERRPVVVRTQRRTARTRRQRRG